MFFVKNVFNLNSVLALLSSIIVAAPGYAAIQCPNGYALVPGNSALRSAEFCVMKYGAKAWDDKNKNGQIDAGEIRASGCDGTGKYCDGGHDNWGSSHIPVSVPQGIPWRKISRDSAIERCQSLNSFAKTQPGMKYDLISNREWQTVARNIEKQAGNWSGGKVGAGCLNQGNTGYNSQCSYASDGPERGGDKRSSHVLSNGEEIYHFSGNLWQWVKDDNKSKQGDDRRMSTAAGTQYGPEGSYKCDSGNNYCGFGSGFLNYNAGAVLRGGDWVNNDYAVAGVFAASLFRPPSDSDLNVGFRCVLHTTSSNSDDPNYE